jgi:hypothetical protein
VIFNTHSDLSGKHAFLSASKYHWTNYDDEKLDRVYMTFLAAQRGTELHAFACEAIRLRVKLPKSPKTLNLYVNDAIGYRMRPEQTLYYSENCFGTADAISFSKGLLRIHDLKTGINETSVRQLEVYAALFCLEYRTKPLDIGVELRIYQNDEIQIFAPDPETLIRIMDKIISFDRRIKAMKMEALL